MTLLRAHPADRSCIDATITGIGNVELVTEQIQTAWCVQAWYPATASILPACGKAHEPGELLRRRTGRKVRITTAARADLRYHLVQYGIDIDGRAGPSDGADLLDDRSGVDGNRCAGFAEGLGRTVILVAYGYVNRAGQSGLHANIHPPYLIGLGTVRTVWLAERVLIRHRQEGNEYYRSEERAEKRGTS